VADLTDDQKIDLARACIEALNARDFRRYFACTHQDYVIRTDPSWAGGGVVAGRAALIRFFEEFFEHWADVRYEFLDDPVVIGGRVFGRDRWVGSNSTGDEMEVEFYSVASFREGLIESVDLFFDHDEALEFARSGAVASRRP
jgi:ketosteroid isomerase-like protein